MLIALLVLLGGMIVTYLARRDLLLGWKSLRWPTATGKISDKRIVEGDRVGISSDGTNTPVTRHWKELEISYSYTVNERNYTSSQIDFSGFGLRGETRYYEDGEEVTVYYDPADPEVAVLRPGFRFSMLFGPIITLVGIYLTISLR